MIRVLFVCHGNICRSPMAEFYMKDIVKKAGLDHEIYVESAATSTEEIGNPVYPPARRKLQEHGISCEGKRARQIKRADYDAFDYLIVMDTHNVRNAMRIFKDDPKGKLHMLLEYANRDGESVADPWYTGDFDATWEDVSAGCDGLFVSIKEQNL